MLRERTGKLFGDLWHRYDTELFRDSVDLFHRRCAANGFETSWLKGKNCVDVGCGGGRYALAKAECGAESVVALDLSHRGVSDAARLAATVEAMRFVEADALDLPFPDVSFDFAWCSGVLHHTGDTPRGVTELTRILHPGGKLFVLVYGEGGIRWPTILAVRPLAAEIGYMEMDRAMRKANLQANKQRTFLDDLFVPVIEFYDFASMSDLLRSNGMTDIERWKKGKLDHEASPEVQRAELVQLAKVFAVAAEVPHDRDTALAACREIMTAIDELDRHEADFAAGRIDAATRDQAIFGVGHLRLMATKGH